MGCQLLPYQPVANFDWILGSQSNWRVFIFILEHLDRMTEVSALAITCKFMHNALSKFLFNKQSLPTDERSRNLEIFSLLIGATLYRTFDSHAHFDQILTLRYAREYYRETPEQHLIRNYLVFIPPSVGLHKRELIERVQREQPVLLERFMNMDEEAIKPILGESYRCRLSFVELRGELMRNIKVLKLLVECNSLEERLQILNEQRFKKDRQLAEEKAMEELSTGLASFVFYDHENAQTGLTLVGRPSVGEPGTVVVDAFEETTNLFSIPYRQSRGTWHPKAAPRVALRDLRPVLHRLGCVK